MNLKPNAFLAARWLPYGRVALPTHYGARATLAGPNTWKDESSATLAGQVPFYRGAVLSWWRHSTGQTVLMSRVGKVQPVKHWDSDVRFAARKAAIRARLSL